MYKSVNLHEKKSSALIVHCADPRFQSAYRQAVDEIGMYYDLLVFPGASKAIVENRSVIENIKLLHELHGFETIHIMDHIECGVFGKTADEVKDHTNMLESAQELLKKEIPGIATVGHLLGDRKELELQLKR